MDRDEGRRLTGEKRGRSIAVAFGLSALASLALMVVYVEGGQPQLEGILIGIALGGIGYGLVVWGKDLMPGGHQVEERISHASSEDEREELVAELVEDETGIERRRFLGRLLALAGGTLGIAALFPIRSLGSDPGSDLLHTEWSEGARLVTPEGSAVGVDELEVGGIVTVFPEGHTDAADSQVVLIRVDPNELELSPERMGWTHDGYIAYSKVCTHAGCPVGLYEPESNELFCPCHQSIFDVLDGATPIAGPATTPLPQLPIAADETGNLIAQSDFHDPVGPLFWRRDS